MESQLVANWILQREYFTRKDYYVAGSHMINVSSHMTRLCHEERVRLVFMVVAHNDYEKTLVIADREFGRASLVVL